jgi:hypothetical protein
MAGKTGVVIGFYTSASFMYRSSCPLRTRNDSPRRRLVALGSRCYGTADTISIEQSPQKTVMDNEAIQQPAAAIPDPSATRL